MLDKMMKSLAEALKVGDFIASENGSYNIEVDQLSLTIKQRASWILWEATLPFQLKEHLDYQQEQALQRCMQLSLKTIREDGGVLTTNDDQQLILQSKVRVEDCSVERFSALLSKHVNLYERYIALLEQERVNHTINHTVWLP
ncbi:YscB family type III secretion system chaperone [Vibrio alginolyticus]|uniref:YscB family type III secretion system chaperone n=1 Tax=Vibrio alginolyticus TaxID=663 RepID=UPI001EE9C94D|nr:YscB family type III secretion system chaperone [Vibrio alginolyticus]MCG6310698.1 YscB family type III secretion system chaperone [Vibrio alginolyticus]